MKTMLLDPTEFGCRVLGGLKGTGPNRQHRHELIESELVASTYTQQQFAIQQAIRTNRRVVVHSGHSTGKSFVCADVVLWFMKAFRPCKVVTTAPTMRQVSDILWRTLRSRYRGARIPLGGRLLPKAPLWEFGDEHFAEGLSTDEPERMLGYHSPHLLVVMDEAAGVKEPIWDAVRRLATGEMNFVLAIGNPGAPAGPFYDAAVNDHTWSTIHLDSEDHPNVKTGVEIVPGAATRAWCDEMADAYGGRSSMRYVAYVKGEFPTEGVDTLISPQWVDRAMRGVPMISSGYPRVVISADVARFGDDETVIATIAGGNHVRTIYYHGRDLMHTVGVIAAEFRRHDKGTAKIVVDADGIGAGVVDRLRELDIPVIAFHGGLPPLYRPGRRQDRRRERFKNLRSQAWYLLAEALRNEELRLKEDKRTKAQLTALTYSFHSDGTIQLEKKDDLKKRLPNVGSPDRGDALAMGWWLLDNWSVDHIPQGEERARTWQDEAMEIMGGR